MENMYSYIYSSEVAKRSAFNILLITAIYFIPSISHIINFPLYLLDPMRIAVILSIIFTSRNNTFLLALTLPVFSFVVSSHPYLIKAVLISSELFINVWIFYLLFNIWKKYFWSMLAGVFVAKIFYYAAKYILISFNLIDNSLISSPLLFQLGVAVVLSILLDIVMIRQNRL
jgi:hypothetical protein